MVEKKFYLESAEELQRIGLRVHAVSFLIENGIEKGNVLNDSTNNKRVIVAVRFDANPANAATETKEIEKIKEEMVKHLNNLASTDPECYGHIPNNIHASELHDLNNPHAVTTVDLQRLSSALMLEQTGKGVGAMLHLARMNIKLAETIQTTFKPLNALPQILDEMRKDLGQMNKRLEK